MISRTLQTGLIPVLASVAFLCISGTAHANFKYIPNTDGGAGANEPATSSTVTTTPVQRMPVSPQPTSMTTSTEMTGGDVINGFGTQVPLVIALREIVPASYQFAYADGLNLGTLVNWKGGKPWRDVLRSVVTPLGLTATEKNSVIYVDHSDAVIQTAR